MKGVRGLSYVAIDPGIAMDDKVVRIAAELRRPRVSPIKASALMVAGTMPQFLGEVQRQAPDGDLSPFSDDTLDTWAGGWAGFGRLVRETMCDTRGVLTAWETYNGAALKSLVAGRNRVAEWRRRKSEEKRQPRPQSADGNVTGDVTVGGLSGDGTALTDTVTVTVTEKPTTQLPTPSPRARGVDEFLGAVREDAAALEFLPEFEGAFRSAQFPDSLASEFRAMLAGLNMPEGRPATLAALGQGLRDIRVNRTPFTAQTLRVYAAKLLRPRRGARPPEQATESPRPFTRAPRL